MLARRNLLQNFGLGAAGAFLASGFHVNQTSKSKTANSTESSKGAPWWLFEPLSQGDFLGKGWYLANVSGIEQGAFVITLQTETNRTARIHVCSHFGASQGIAATRYLDFVLMDGGKGNTPSEENLGRIILSLAKHVQATEDYLFAKGILDILDTHENRLLLYKDTGLT